MTNSKLEKCLDTVPFGVLPDGELIRPRWATEPRYWLSDEPVPPGTWSRLRALHSQTGLWPVFLHGHEDDPAYPWEKGEVGEPFPRSADQYDAETVLTAMWAEQTRPEPTAPPDEVAEMAIETAPFGQTWPGRAPRIEPTIPPDQMADDFAERLINSTDTRLGLFPVERGADVLGFTGWQGASESEPVALSSVLRDWEDRFGVRVLRIGFNTLVLSVAAPPTTSTAAIHVAAEHFAFCRDNVWYGKGALTNYAEELIDVPHWSFLWDQDLPPDW